MTQNRRTFMELLVAVVASCWTAINSEIPKSNWRIGGIVKEEDIVEVIRVSIGKRIQKDILTSGALTTGTGRE